MKTFQNLLITAALLILSVGVQASTRITFLHSDATGSPVAATNEAGAVIWRKTYAPYGKASNKDGDNRIGYTGHVEDQNGLVYAGARYYDPALGRFLSDDPSRFDENKPMSFNRYLYANNNPYRFTDPNGRDPVDGSDEERPGTALIQAVHNVAEVGSTISEKGSEIALDPSTYVPEEAVGVAIIGKLAGVAGITRLASGGAIFKTTKEASIAAEKLGFKKMNEAVHGGQAVYTDGKRFITRDVDGHNGGAWKVADSIKNLGSKETRAGTFSEDLKNRIGD